MIYDLLFIDLFVVARKVAELVAEFRSFSSSLSLDLTCKCLEFVNVFGSNIFFNRKQFHIESFLVCLLKESNQELWGFQHWGLKNRVQETLVVQDSFRRLVLH